MKQEHLEIEYRKNRKQYEEQEEELYHQRDKGIQMLEEIAESTDYYLRNLEEDRTARNQSLYVLEEMKEEIVQVFKADQTQIEESLEQLEINYHKQQQQLIEQENETKEGEIEC
ncbi:hypothetical protein A5821_000849 [Enterococcus sp. 7F3_DIV0205]|uniref:Uncharacterized protein n=1 Tax=Candidatus Enterococcus palustris TaxID=1834189 RepID=A0AAQ3W6X1_9ENTE|nr:hypothetical protein [Enterococcus sp. 7F3_DIV0205]OTN85264.1 hypothetical protein A5821_001193 [Enterococcus sp. 7F3_DIV0205]